MSTALEPESVATASSSVDSAYLFTTEDFCKMIDAEIFPDEARLELWDGRIYEKMAETFPHAAAGITVNATLNRALPPGWCLSPENPIALGVARTPLPDMVILRGTGHDYFERRAEVADVGLVVEVSVSSLKLDTGSKLAAYAEAGIPADWVVNLVDGAIHVYTTPIPAERRYASVLTFKVGETIPLTLDGVAVAQVAASDILPRR